MIYSSDSHRFEVRLNGKIVHVVDGWEGALKFIRLDVGGRLNSSAWM